MSRELPADTSLDSAFQSLQKTAVLLSEELERDITALGETPLSAVEQKELRQKIVDGLVRWAINMMGKDSEAYLEQARANFADMLKLGVVDGNLSFREALSEAVFIVPQSLQRESVHHSRWAYLYEQYISIRHAVENVTEKTKRASSVHKFALREILPGISDQRIQKFAEMKASDIALDYTIWKFKLAIGRESLQKYFSQLHHPNGLKPTMTKSLFKALGKLPPPSLK